MRIDDVPHDRKTQTRPFSVRLCREERLEDPISIRLGHTRSRVGDLDDDVAGAVWSGANEHLSAGFDRVDRVGDQVDQDLLELAGDRLDHGELGVDLDRQGDAAALHEMLADRYRLPNDG